jgi:replicative DNA helicase
LSQLNYNIDPKVTPFPNSNLNNNQSNNDTSSLISSFLNKFAEVSFIEKIINISLYQSDFITTATNIKSTEVVKFIEKFLIDLNKEVNNGFVQSDVPPKIVSEFVRTAREILNLRADVSSRLITYDNITQHFPKRNIHVDKLLQNIKESRIQNTAEFRKTSDLVLQVIECYNELKEIRVSLTQLGSFIDDSKNSDIPILNLVKNYKEIISEAYSSISALRTLSKQETLSDYIVLSDEESVKETVKSLVSFLSDGYSFYKTGYSLIDTYIGGIESSSVTLISAPSNHAKSLFSINLLRNIIINNINDFEAGDTFIFFTLEDDIYKLIRRFMSIFGNYSSKLVRRLFIRSSTLLKEQKYRDIKNVNTATSEIFALLSEIISNSVFKTTGKKINLILKHCNENTFSPADLTRFIDKLNMEGMKTKLIIVDYIDVMSPNDYMKGNASDVYYNHGQITQELRLAGRLYNMPVIALTQNTRSSENTMNALSNELMADSVRKVRYSDYILMLRMRRDLELLGETVKQDIYNEDSTTQLTIQDFSANEYIKELIPFEMKITKAKDGEKDRTKFLLFSGTNTRIYDMMDDFFTDLPEYKNINKKLEDNLNLLGTNDNTLLFSDDDEIDLI